MTKSVITEAIEKALAEGRPARIPFLTAGFPNRTDFFSQLVSLDDNGADIIEIGLPFSDPVADGPVVAKASMDAVEDGVNLEWLLDGLGRLSLKAPLVLMSYANPLLQHAFARTDPAANLKTKMFSALKMTGSRLKEAGLAGAIIPDAPLEESSPFHEGLAAASLDYIPLVGPNTSLERMRKYSPLAGGYVYVVSVLGATGVRDDIPTEVVQTLQRAREAFSLPLALGFGLKDPSQLAGFPVQPDAVIFGSALLKHILSGEEAGTFLKRWQA